MPEATGKVYDLFEQVQIAARVVEKAGFQKADRQSRFYPNTDGSLWFHVVVPVKFTDFSLDDEALAEHVKRFIRSRCDQTTMPRIAISTPSGSGTTQALAHEADEEDHRPTDLRTKEGREWRARQKQKAETA